MSDEEIIDKVVFLSRENAGSGVHIDSLSLLADRLKERQYTNVFAVRTEEDLRKYL